MIKNDVQLGRPLKPYEGTKANIEALTGLTGGEFAHATDTGDDGFYNNVTGSWVWIKRGNNQPIIIMGEAGEEGPQGVPGIGSQGVIGATGATGADGRPGGASVVLFDHYADVGNVGTGEDDLYSDTIAAGQLANNGDKLAAEYSGNFVSSATATRQLKVKFAGTTLLDTGALATTAAAVWKVRLLFIRVSATVIRYEVDASYSVLSTGVNIGSFLAVGELTGLTLSGTNILKLTGEAAGVGAATNDIVAKLGTVLFIKLTDPSQLFNDAEGNPAPLGVSGDGTSTYAARRDHVHAGSSLDTYLFNTSF